MGLAVVRLLLLLHRVRPFMADTPVSPMRDWSHTSDRFFVLARESSVRLLHICLVFNNNTVLQLVNRHR